MRRIYIIGVTVLALLAGCDKGPQPADVAAQAGKAYYGQLLQGDVDAYVAGIDGAANAPADYRRMLADNARQFLHRQDSLRNGIQSVETDSASFSDRDSTARVFLRLTYGDGSHERVLLPMLCRNGLWYMR